MECRKMRQVLRQKRSCAADTITARDLGIAATTRGELLWALLHRGPGGSNERRRRITTAARRWHPLELGACRAKPEETKPVLYAKHKYTAMPADFYTPAYFDPSSTTGSKYSFCGRLRSARDVLPGGHLSWRNPASGDWTRLANDANGLHAIDLGPIAT